MKKHIDDNCIFCKLANGQIPTNSIYEDDDFKVILDAAPAAKGHAIILPKTHAENLFEDVYKRQDKSHCCRPDCTCFQTHIK